MARLLRAGLGRLRASSLSWHITMAYGVEEQKYCFYIFPRHISIRTGHRSSLEAEMGAAKMELKGSRLNVEASNSTCIGPMGLHHETYPPISNPSLSATIFIYSTILSYSTYTQHVMNLVPSSDVPAQAWPRSPGFGLALGGFGFTKS